MVLAPYRAALLAVERDLLADPTLTAAHVHRALDPFLLLLPAVGGLVEDVGGACEAAAQGGGTVGCGVLELVYRWEMAQGVVLSVTD